MVRLLSSPSKADKEMSKIARAMAKLDRKVPERAGGQHMLVKAIVAVARGRKDHSSHLSFSFGRSQCAVGTPKRQLNIKYFLVLCVCEMFYVFCCFSFCVCVRMLFTVCTCIGCRSGRVPSA